jgi:hypothetical protein
MGMMALQLSFGQERLAPLRDQWHKTTTAHFICYTAKGTLADSALPFLHKKLEEYRLTILQMIGEPQYEPTIEVFFFDTPELFTYYIRKQAQGISYARQQLACFIFSRKFDGFSAHELAHIISINLWGPGALWMEEGLATLADESLQTKDFHQQAKELWKSGEWLDIQDVQKHFNRYDGQWRRYVVSASLLKYIQQQYGTRALKECWQPKKILITGVESAAVLDEWMKLVKGL